MSVLWHTQPTESQVGDGIRLDLALGSRAREASTGRDRQGAASAVLAVDARLALAACKGRLEPRTEYGTGLRSRLEANGVPLIAALAGRLDPRYRASEGRGSLRA